MTVEVADVLAAAGAGTTDTDTASALLAEAELHVDGYIERNIIDAAVPVPDELRDAAVLVCATDLFARYKAPFGQQIAGDADGNVVTVRLGADPLGGVRPKLRAYCVEIGFAFPVDETTT